MTGKYKSLREAAEDVAGWSGIDKSWKVDGEDSGGQYEFGAIDDDGCKCPVAVFDADIYGTAGGSKNLANFYAQANSWKIRELLADHDSLATEVDGLREAMSSLIRGYVNLMEAGRDRIKALGGECDPIDDMEASDPWLKAARAALSKQSAEAS